jgi:hypothetical protein
MSYALDLTSLARRQLQSQPEPLRTYIFSALERLAVSPASFGSRPSTIPLGQSAEIEYRHEGVVLWISVVFRYGQDEETLHIEQILVEYG